jgi:hypothetical protein
MTERTVLQEAEQAAFLNSSPRTWTAPSSPGTTYPALLGRFVFLTGDVLGQETRAFLARAGRPSRNKPYQLGEIQQAVHRLSRAGVDGRRSP